MRDYTLRSEVDCDPKTELCFVRDCVDDCDENAEETFYKLRSVKAYDIAICDPHVGVCPELECSELSSCVEQFCSQELLPQGERCSALDGYVKSDIPQNDIDEDQGESVQ